LCSASLLAIAIFINPVIAQRTLDVIVASVDGNPITLQDISQRIPGGPAVSTQELSEKGVAQDALNALIDEALVSAEAQDRKIIVEDNDVTSYMNVVAQQNQMSVDDFVSALEQRGINKEQYRKQVRHEILRSKIASAVAQTSTSISEEELEDAVGVKESELSEEDSEEAKDKIANDKIVLRQIVIYREGKSDNDFSNKIEATAKKLLGTETFDAIARSSSEGAEAREGGSLGLVSTTDLSEEMQEHLTNLKPGQISKPLISPDAARFFMIDKNNKGTALSAQQSIMQDARARLKQSKTMQTIDTFFAKTMPEKHVIERFY